MKASAAKPFASSAEPALNPNQPNHSIDAPIIVIVRLCGGMLSLPKPTRLPSTIAPTKPATPALMCTTVPPAKSSAPQLPDQARRRVGSSSAVAASVYASGPAQNQTMCATGMYANVNQMHEEQQHGRELDALDERSQDQAARDRRERRLERDEHDLVHRRRFAERRAEREHARRRVEHAVQEQPSRCYRRTRCRS